MERGMRLEKNLKNLKSCRQRPLKCFQIASSEVAYMFVDSKLNNQIGHNMTFNIFSKTNIILSVTRRGQIWCAEDV